jgi:hypothetical protein
MTEIAGDLARIGRHSRLAMIDRRLFRKFLQSGGESSLIGVSILRLPYAMLSPGKMKKPASDGFWTDLRAAKMIVASLPPGGLHGHSRP